MRFKSREDDFQLTADIYKTCNIYETINASNNKTLKTTQHWAVFLDNS